MFIIGDLIQLEQNDRLAKYIQIFVTWILKKMRSVKKSVEVQYLQILNICLFYE